jgi:hypothetical protein
MVDAVAWGDLVAWEKLAKQLVERWEASEGEYNQDLLVHAMTIALLCASRGYGTEATSLAVMLR